MDPNLSKLLEDPLYSYADADYLAALGRGTARRWFFNSRNRDDSSSGQGLSASIAKANNGRQPLEGVSFLQLVELVAVGGMKQIGFTLPQIRGIVGVCRSVLKSPYPLAMEQLKDAGREIFVDRSGEPLGSLGRKGAQAWESVLRPLLGSLDYEDGIGRRWWPMGRDGAIVVDPSFAFGLPTIWGTGVRTEIIVERFQAGDLDRPIEQIAEEFNISARDVRQALRFEISRLEKARLAA
jgi:uncharacterized protein (DUF433 family)